MINMLEKITLRIFLICLVSCASLVLTLIWIGGPDAPLEIYFKIAFTLFVVGLGSFLCWFVMMLHSLRNSLRKS